MIIMDFSKAFDTLPHNRLLNKLNRYDIRNKTHNWISNFLKYRKQRVVIGGEHSTWTQVISGVPQITATANRTLAFVRRNLYSCPQHIKQSAYTTLVRPLLEYSSSVWDSHTKTLVNKIEMVQRRAARFCHNDYKTIEKGCMSEMIGKLNLEPLNIRRTNRRLTIFHKDINGHLALLPIGHLPASFASHSSSQ